jgi:hypothetical protein
MNSYEIVATALRVLVAWTDGRKPDAADVDLLRTAVPTFVDLQPDDLARQIIHRLGSHAMRASNVNGTPPIQSDQNVA